MDKRNVVFTHDYSRMGKGSIIRIESENPVVKAMMSKKIGSTNSLPETPEEKFFKLFINSIKKSNRTFADNQIIVNFIQGMYDFFHMLKRCLDNYLDLINIISQTIRYEYHEPNQVMFRTGDKGEKFYVIFKGHVNILVAKDIKMMMTEEEYIKYLEKLSDNEEYFLMNACLNVNRKIINVDMTNPTGRKIFKRQSKIKKEKLKLAEILKYNNDGSQEKSTYNDHFEYIERLKPKHNPEKVNKDTKLFELKVWQYFHVLTLQSGQYFGDTALISNDQRRYCNNNKELQQ